ncbi:hypothetical protein JX266_005773 [Neoarthrinium moseri]|nr:hypothetical protein JX266_005773 [Neoarthrinium moseri]
MAGEEVVQVAAPLSQGVGYGILIGVGAAFAIGMSTISWALSRYLDEVQDSEMFMTAKHSVKTGLIASAVVSSWTIATTLLTSTTYGYQYGVSGPFWYACGATVQILLFSVAAIELKRKAPNAQTFLQVVKVRYGKAVHLIFCTYCMVYQLITTVNLLVGGSAVFSTMTGVNRDAACFLFPIGVVIYTLMGGIKATFITDWVHTVIIYLIMLLCLFVFYTTSDIIGSPEKMWELLKTAATIHPVDGNAQGEYLTMRSEGGGYIGLVFIGAGFASATDSQLFQKAIAADRHSISRGYIIGGLSWFTIPFVLASTFGLAAAAIEHLPVWPTYPNRMNDYEIASGMAMPYAALALMGNGGVIAVLLMVFMAVTSAMSSETVATTALLSYNVYQAYVHPGASGKQLLFFSHFITVGFAIVSASIAVAFNHGGFSVGFLITAIGIFVDSAVVPMVCTIFWKKQSRLAAIISPLASSAAGITAWFLTAYTHYGVISIETLSGNLPLVAGNMMALTGPMLLTPLITYLQPEDFDWQIFHTEIKRGDDEHVTVHAHDERHHGAISHNSESWDDRKMVQARWRSLGIAAFLVISLAILWPIPMYASHYVFSQTFFRGWVIVLFIWAFIASIIITVLPIWEGKDMALALLRRVLGRKTSTPADEILTGEVAPSSEKSTELGTDLKPAKMLYGKSGGNRLPADSSSELGVRTVAIYTDADAESQHVLAADEASMLEGDASSAYLDGKQIIAIAKASGAQAIIPGYGFLSENAEFVRMVAAAGLTFVGPSADAIESMGLKHTARELAVAVSVPVIPGSRGLLSTADVALAEAQNLGFPVMLKATAGGGGMGLLICHNEQDVKQNFEQVKSRGVALFKNEGVFLEKYYPDSHHIEVQIFGNGQGKVISIGERECSIQRRHQKVIEECPSPFVSRKEGLRQKLTKDGIRLAESINYGSAGTIEYLVDDHTGDYFFLEMNTRLQVEHGVTEMCFDVDIVHLMLKQADRQLGGTGGLPADDLCDLQTKCLEPRGHAIEARVYAENPARNFSPSPGLLQQVHWHLLDKSRVDTWVRPGNVVSPMYDPLLAKLMHHAPSRERAISEFRQVLVGSQVRGPPVNLDFLLAILDSEQFKSGATLTRMLDTFNYAPAAIDVLSGGSYTLIQDYPGRPTVGHGFGHAGPMDPISFRVANALVGNSMNTEALEITLTGPELLFLGEATISLCGPEAPAYLDASELPMWTRVHVRAGQKLKVGKLVQGCRSYLAVYGGFPNVAQWFGSKSTNPMVNVGGYQGRALRAGDFLRIVDSTPLPTQQNVSVPRELIPQYDHDCWDIQVMSGPYETGYLSTEDIEMLFSTAWQVSHNAARGGIRLIGPRPKFSRADGGEGGAHPSNVIDYGYPIGGLNWTGDEPVIFPVDCPDFGGFICSLTVIKADYWKIGQIRSGDHIRFRRVTLDGALECRKKSELFIDLVDTAIRNGSWDEVASLDRFLLAPETKETGVDMVHVIGETRSSPKVSYRAGGDDFLLVEYGDGKSDLNNKCRATALRKCLEEVVRDVSSTPYANDEPFPIMNMVGCGNSLMIYYDGLRLSRDDLLTKLVEIESSFGDMRSIKFPNRRFRLPLTFKHRKIDAMMDRYMANQRSKASYLPDPFQFVAANNGLTSGELKKMLLGLESVVIGVGFFMALPESLPVDPRQRLQAPKMNPSRTFTPAGTFSWGGCAIAVYPVDSPGGYMPLGMTIPGVDVYGSKLDFSEQQPWMFQDMDVITYYEVTEDEYDRQMALFRSGGYRFEYEEDVFDMATHNEFLQQTRDETQQVQQNIAAAQAKMVKLEKKLLEEWIAEKMSNEPDPNELQALLEDSGNRVVESPVNANVWKMLAVEGETLRKGQTVAILEAMKMEINVLVEDELDGSTVLKLLAQPGHGMVRSKIEVHCFEWTSHITYFLLEFTYILRRANITWAAK